MNAVVEASTSSEMSPFTKTIYEAKYSWQDDDGNPLETWCDTSHRVLEHVLGILGYSLNSPEFKSLFKFISERKFIPGGRYLYAAGRQMHQTNNCFLYRAEDSREGWAKLQYKTDMALMTGGGIGVDYSDIRAYGAKIGKTGGISTGPLALMQMVNEAGRHIMQGGNRRSAIWAGLAWDHADCERFIKIKDWDPRVKALKEEDFNFPAPMDMTNVSVLLDDMFFISYQDVNHPKHELAHHIYDMTISYMVRTGEPGFSVNIGRDAGETLRNAPVAGDTYVLTQDGYKPVSSLIDTPTSVWTGQQYAENVVFSLTQTNAPIIKVEMSGGRTIRCEPNHEFLIERWKGAGPRRKLDRIDRVKAKDLQPEDQPHVSMTWNDPVSKSPGNVDSDGYELGYVYGDGSFTKAGGAEVTFCTDLSKECFSNFTSHSNVNLFDGRGYTRAYFGVSERWKGRTKDTFPTEMYQAEPLKAVSFVAGLFDSDGNYEPTQRRIRLASKHYDFLVGVRRLLEQYGILSGISKAGFSTYGKAQGYQLVIMTDYHDEFVSMIPVQRLQMEFRGPGYRRAAIKVIDTSDDGYEDVYCADVKVSEHSFMAEGVIISNCCEITSHDDSDVCNLGSINLSRIESKEELEEVVDLATLFLLAGTLYSAVPHDEVYETRAKNRRIGLGLMGIHEWLLRRGEKYEPSDALSEWLEVYAKSGDYANKWADKHVLSRPIKTRAIAPNGTIGIIGETTTSAEPIFCVAFKRRYLSDDQVWKYQYVIDPTAKRLIEDGIDPDDIEDAYVLAYNVEKRVAFQAWLQGYVDHAISSTINLPYSITDPREVEDFGDMLIQYLPRLRGITCYPDGSRGGQPLTVIPYEVAKNQLGVVFEEDPAKCVGGVCGI